MDNFQKTVDLKKKSKADEIERIYNHEGKDENLDFKKIKKPEFKRVNKPIFKKIMAVLFLIIVLAAAYFIFFKKDKAEESKQNANKWYAVKLVNNEIYYGQVEDAKADPIVIKNVYYNYDQKKEAQENDETGSLRLVKRGNETHGPAGEMSIIRAQVLYLELLKEDSKVLKAILDYEK